MNPAADLLKKATTRTANSMSRTVEVCKNKVTNALTAEKTGMQLAESTMPPFLHPKDPFVVLKGENLVGIDRARAQRPDKDAGVATALPAGEGRSHRGEPERHE